MPFGSRFLVVAAGLLAVPLAVRLERPVDVKPPLTAAKVDPRAVRLARFFSKLHCPVKDLAAEFVRAADKNKLDWRLLPSISVIESGGGKAYRNNNIFGWGNGNLKFPSIKAGLQEVASKLGRSPLYKNRDSFGKLRVYNPDEQYALRVIDVMNQI
ncbi:MAG TPA: hypothetical protein VLJ11_13400 [Bryobacteraceae bacterium]|nr:hypothetical protein [Bryobacteraceae bacterium]